MRRNAFIRQHWDEEQAKEVAHLLPAWGCNGPSESNMDGIESSPSMHLVDAHTPAHNAHYSPFSPFRQYPSPPTSLTHQGEGCVVVVVFPINGAHIQFELIYRVLVVFLFLPASQPQLIIFPVSHGTLSAHTSASTLFVVPGCLHERGRR